MSTSGGEPSPNWLELPRDITAAILLRLGQIEILNTAQRVCSQWRSICKERSMWRTIDMRDGGKCELWEEGALESICRLAVDRSCGGLVDISIYYFATNELISYITASCTQIKRLRLASCYQVWDEGLGPVAAKLSLLEELDLSYCSLCVDTLDAMGRHCPRLKSLKFNRKAFQYPYMDGDEELETDEELECNEEALAIARTMPELRHLQLFGNDLTKVGLEAILDGCPHLESLDLRQCFNVDLSGKLGKRCAERVKNLRRPLDSTYDYEYSAELQKDASSDEVSPSGFPDIDIVSDDNDRYDFSGSEYDYDYDSYSDDYYD